MSNDSTRKPDPLSPDSGQTVLETLSKLFAPSPMAQIQRTLEQRIIDSVQAELKRRERAATPAVAPISPAKPIPTAEPVGKPTESQQDKLHCQQIARELWADHPEWRQADLLKHSQIKRYASKWKGKNTVPGWLSEVDPRPKEQRRGAPKKYPA
jgi:hypothetical protein